MQHTTSQEEIQAEYRGFKLDPFQIEAIRHLNEGRSVLVSAPTGVGKTLVAGGATLLLGLPMRTAVFVGLGLAQVGEFSFVLAKSGLDRKLIDQNGYQLFLEGHHNRSGLFSLCAASAS